MCREGGVLCVEKRSKVVLFQTSTVILLDDSLDPLITSYFNFYLCVLFLFYFKLLFMVIKIEMNYDSASI